MPLGVEMRLIPLLILFFISAPALWSASPKENLDMRAKQALEQGDLLEARDLYETYLNTHGDDADVLAWLGGVYGMMADPLGQERVCLRALHMDPGHTHAFINLGNAECALNEWDDGERSYLSAYGVAREKGTTLQRAESAYALCNFYLDRPTQDNDAALEWADVCLSHLDADMARGAHKTLYHMATLNKASALANKGDFDTAKDVLKTYLEAYPGQKDAREMLELLDERALSCGADA